MEILLGTHNPSKKEYFTRQLAEFDVSFVTLSDLGIEKLPDEDGKNVLENAQIKAAYYGQFHERVISADSALYIRELSLTDPRQPGLTIRRAADGHSMTEDEMLAYYAGLARSLGGQITCWYQDAYAVSNHGVVHGFMDDGPVNDVYSFYMVDTPHPKRNPGWPLDSISIRRSNGKYFVESQQQAVDAVSEVLMKDYRRRLMAFYEETLGLKRR